MGRGEGEEGIKERGKDGKKEGRKEEGERGVGGREGMEKEKEFVPGKPDKNMTQRGWK